MLGSEFVCRTNVRLMDLFAAAGAADKIVTRIRLGLSSSEDRARILDAFHSRWEKKVLDDLDAGGLELEKQLGRTDIVQKRRENARSNLEYARDHKENLLHFRV